MRIKDTILIVLFILYNFCLVFSYHNEAELTERIINLQSSVNDLNRDLDKLEVDVNKLNNQIENF